MDSSAVRAALPRGWKTKARERVRAIVAGTPDGPVTGPDGDWLAALLALHPEAAGKIGSGVSWIGLGPVPGYRSRGFTVHRTDGSSTDFSWRECITPYSHQDKCRSAMRNAVLHQVLAFRDSREWPLSCALDPAHPGPFQVDHHDPPFAELADSYAAAKGGYAGISLVPHGDGDISDELAPGDMLVWVPYHHSAARLRIVCAPCNSKGRDR
jgi:hypothetical protein